jgi:hypothetical protein
MKGHDMANKSDITKLAEKIVSTDDALEEYRQMVLDLETVDHITVYDIDRLKTYRQEVINLQGIRAGLWVAAATLTIANEVEAKVIELKEAKTLKLTGHVHRSPFA